MKLKIKKPITPSQRHLVQLNMSYLTRKSLIKSKIKKVIINTGRNNSGKITVRHKGGGHKKKYRKINFLRNKDLIGLTINIEYDPNRNCNIAAIYSLSDFTFFYILAPKNLKIGDIVKSGVNINPKLGYSLPLESIPIGSYIHNVARQLNKHSQLARAAGAFAIIKEKTPDFVLLELNSGKKTFIHPKCFATIGKVSNEFAFLTKLGKAGRSRWLNKRPTVRGVAMNPIDHPHGGGEGKKSGKGKTPWGKTVKKGKTK